MTSQQTADQALSIYEVAFILVAAFAIGFLLGVAVP